MMRLFLLFTIMLLYGATTPSPVAGRKICIDPGHGGTALTDSYRVGILGEREEWINLRVALALKKMLEAKGAEVVMTRSTDVRVELEERSRLATSNKADLFVSIHHNATADPNVNFPIVYFHGAASENKASVMAADAVAREIRKQLFNGKGHISVVSDYTIFPEKGASVLRNTYGIPAVLAEASFFTNMEEEKRLGSDEYNFREATAYTRAIEEIFSRRLPKIRPKAIPDRLPVFHVLQEADRMKPEALNWLNDYETGKELMKEIDTTSLRRAYELFTRSAMSFPDSWVARECHENRSLILQKLKKGKASREEAMRAKEYYLNE